MRDPLASGARALDRANAAIKYAQWLVQQPNERLRLGDDFLRHLAETIARSHETTLSSVHAEWFVSGYEAFKIRMGKGIKKLCKSGLSLPSSAEVLDL